MRANTSGKQDLDSDLLISNESHRAQPIVTWHLPRGYALGMQQCLKLTLVKREPAWSK
jgi:hypothetical protein